MNTTDVLVRAAIINDAEGIAHVHVEGWRFAYRDILPRVFLDTLSVESRSLQWRQGIKSPSPRSSTIVATMEDRVIGFCNSGPARDSDAPHTRAELFAIYVDPSEMRRGIGSLVLDACLDKLKQEQFSDVTLWVLDSNEIGRRFYERYGWTNDGVTKTDTIGGVDVRELRYYLNLGNR